MDSNNFVELLNSVKTKIKALKDGSNSEEWDNGFSVAIIESLDVIDEAIKSSCEIDAKCKDSVAAKSHVAPSLAETIERIEAEADKLEEDYNLNPNQLNYIEMFFNSKAKANEFRQLAAWLKELQQYRKSGEVGK